MRIGRDPQHPAPIGVGRRWPAAAPSPRAPRRSRSTGRQRSVLCWRALARSANQVVELELEVELVRERPAGLEVALDEALQPLDDALGLRIGRLAELPVDAAAGRRTRRTPRSAGRRGRGCRPGDPRPASAAAPPATTDSARSRPAGPASAWRRPARRRRRASSPSTRRRPSPGASGRARPGPPRWAPRDRTGRSRPADRPSAETSAAAARTTAAPRAGSHRRSSCRRRSPAARSARGRADPGSLGSSRNSRWISSLNGSSFDPAGARAIARRLIAPKRAADRVAMQPGPPMDLPDRQAAHEMQPPHLRPLLHPDHLGPPELALRKRTQAPRTPGQHSGGPVFNRRRWSSFHPAPTAADENQGAASAAKPASVSPPTQPWRALRPRRRGRADTARLPCDGKALPPDFPSGEASSCQRGDAPSLPRCEARRKTNRVGLIALDSHDRRRGGRSSW